MGGVVVITGAAGGIGSATARAFKDAGWTTAGIDCRRTGSCAVDRYLELDLAADDAADVLASLVDDLGRVDAIVNNAALQVAKPLLETTAEDWQRVLQVNVVAAAMLVQVAAPFMAPGSAVINVGSVHSLATSPGLAAYVASKGAVSALTRAAALELAPRAIRVNCVLPGAVDTPMLRHGLSRTAAGDDGVDSAFRALAARTPLGRVGSPNDIAQAILFLADPERSAFITGQTLVVDGGASARLSTE